MAATDIVSLADAKAQLNITDSSSDAELAGFISAATEPVERYVGKVINRTVTEVFDGGRAHLLLTKLPVASVISVTDSGTVLDSSGYKLDPVSGVLARVAGPSPMSFLPGVLSVSALYVAGQAADIATVAANLPHVRMGALIILQHMWETQRPAAAGPFTQASDDYDPRYAYSVPRRAQELLGVEQAEAVGFA